MLARVEGWTMICEIRAWRLALDFEIREQLLWFRIWNVKMRKGRERAGQERKARMLRCRV